jgi:hypothetical protein
VDLKLCEVSILGANGFGGGVTRDAIVSAMPAATAAPTAVKP